MSRAVRLAVGTWFVAVAVSCTVTRDAGSLTAGQATVGATSGPPMTGDGDATEVDADDSGGDSTGVRLDIATLDMGVDECASVAQSTTIEEGPSDVLVVIDHALSQQSLEATLANFSELIANDNIQDIRVVLLAGYPSGGGGACIDEAPLGVGQCPDNDDNPPMYRHIDETISADTLLDQVLATYDAWGPSMRPEAWKHLWIISSGDASMATGSFVAALNDLDESFERLTVHAMVPVEPPIDCSAFLPGTVGDAGQAVVALAMATGGVVAPLCDYNVTELFDALLDSFQTVSLSCVYEIPEPPLGQIFEKGKVNVDYDDGFGLQTIGYVQSMGECASVQNGWYYDAPLPTEILMCPQTCQRFSALRESSIEIRFGCATVPAG